MQCGFKLCYADAHYLRHFGSFPKTHQMNLENDPISKLKVSGEQPEYFIGLDFYVKDNIKGTEWTKVSDGSNMGIDNFNKNLEALLTKYLLIGNFKGKWVVLQLCGFIRIEEKADS